jgi:hypothetical protein
VKEKLVNTIAGSIMFTFIFVYLNLFVSLSFQTHILDRGQWTQSNAT